MQTSTKAALGAGAATLVGSLVGQGLAVARTAQAMNAQIDADCAFLAQHCYLPDVCHPHCRCRCRLLGARAASSCVAGLSKARASSC